MAVPFALGGDSPFDVHEGGKWSLPAEWREEGAEEDNGGGMAGSFTAGRDDDNGRHEGEGEGEGDDGDDDDSMGGGVDDDEDYGDGRSSFPSDMDMMITTTPEGEGEGRRGSMPSFSAATAGGVRRTTREFARQTYVFSATLTLAATGRQQRRKKHPGGKLAQAEDPVAKIMKRVGVRGEPAIIDMGRRSVEGEGGGAGAVGGGKAAVAEAETAAPPALPSSLRVCSLKSLQVCVLCLVECACSVERACFVRRGCFVKRAFAL